MLTSIRNGLNQTITSAKSGAAAAQRKTKSLNSFRAMRVAFDKAPIGRSLPEAKEFALEQAALHIPVLSKKHCSQFFDELLEFTRPHCKWAYIRREQGSLRLNEYGNTATWQELIAMLRERATISYERSREMHGVSGMHEDYAKVKHLLEYDESRGWTSIFSCGMPSAASERSYRRMQAAADAADAEFEEELSIQS